MDQPLFPIEEGLRDQNKAADAALRKEGIRKSIQGRYARQRFEYGDLVAFYVDTARVQNDGAEPPKSLIARMGKAISSAIGESQHPEIIRETIRRMVKDALSPASFDEVLWQVQADLKGASPEEIALLRDYLAQIKDEYGLNWPTGSRWVRGTGAGTFKRDPLGCDAPTYPVEWTRPDRAEVIAALKKRKETGDATAARSR